MWSVPGTTSHPAEEAIGGRQMHHEHIMIVAFAAVVLALVTGFALMLS